MDGKGGGNGKLFSTPFGMGDIGEPGRGGNGGGPTSPLVGRERDEDEPPPPPLMAAPAVDGLGGSFDCCPELRFSRLLPDRVVAISGNDFLCCAGDGGGCSVAAPEGTTGDGTGEDESEIAASEPRRPRRGMGMGRGAMGDMGERAVVSPAPRVLLSRNHALGFFSGCRSLSLSFVGVLTPFG